MRRFEIYTLGCKVNFAESSARARALETSGWEHGGEPELVVVNTCSVTAAADKKCRNLIARLHRQYPRAAIVATGCYATRAPEQVASLPGVTSVESNMDKSLCAFSLGDRTRSFLKVQDGCDYECGYCTIHSARGASRNPSIAELVDRVREIAAGGVREVVLTGVNTGDFGRSTGERFIDLLRVLDAATDSSDLVPSGEDRRKLREPAQGRNEAGRRKCGEEIAFANFNSAKEARSEHLGRRVDQAGREVGAEKSPSQTIPTGIERFRISSIEPNLLTDEVIELCAASPRFMPHFHIPLQSGCDRILAAMRRRYTTATFAERVARVREKMPETFFGIDVIVGFPGETDDDFEQTYRFLETLRPAELHVFPYSVRPGTPAAALPDKVAPQKIAARAKRLAELSDRLHAEFREMFVGTRAKVLWEGRNADGGSGHAKYRSDGQTTMSGYTENYVRVEAPWDAAKINTIEEIIV